MAFAKTDSFPEETVAMAEFASALSHPARITLLKYLLEHPDCNCGELGEALPLSQPSCSRHLAALRTAGLIHARQVGGEIHYELNRDRIQHFCSSFHCTLSPAS
jgi:DNA-binding transcriptional ArsR family regulator